MGNGLTRLQTRFFGHEEELLDVTKRTGETGLTPLRQPSLAW